MASIRITLTDDEETAFTDAVALAQQKHQRENRGQTNPALDSIEGKIAYARQVAGNDSA